MSMNLSNIAILNIHGVGYCCITSGFSKSEALGLLKIFKFKWEKWNIIKHKNVLSNKDKEVIAFGDPEFEKPKFHQHKKQIF